MNILMIVLAVIAALLAFRCGKVFYRSSKLWGLLGVIVMSFLAAWLLLNGLYESLRTFVTSRSLWSGFGISSLIALVSLFCGGCTDCDKSRRPRHTVHTHNMDAPSGGARKGSQHSVDSSIAGGVATHYDDLKKIEGIGPVLENHLHEHGYHTFNDVAQADVAALRQVLNLGGDRFAIHNPESRPQQAILCAQGARDDLAAYKATLTAGRIV